MKNTGALIPAIAFACLMASPFISIAQKTDDNLPDHGFWVIVSNIHVKRQATVQFFNDEKKLVYEEQITGRKLKLNNKTRRCLKQALDKALASYNSNRLVIQNKNWVAVLLHKK